MNLTGNYTRSADIKSIVGPLKFSDFGPEVLRLMRENKPFVVDDVDTHSPPITNASAYRATQIQSVICVPLHKADRFVAAMAVHMATPRRWQPAETELVQAVAARCWESIERARLERGLRQSEDHFRAFVTTSSDAVYRMSADWSEMRFLKGKDFIPDTHHADSGWIEKYIYPADRDALLAAIGSAIRDKTIFELEHRVIRIDGSVGWTFSRAIPLLDSNGEIVEWFGAATDVTERRLTEEKLREQARILELLKVTGTAIAAELDLQTVVQIVTDAATKLCGAEFGAFFYNTTNERGESYVLYTLSGAPREAFEQFGMPRNTPVFHPTFSGEAIIRSDDISRDPRYGKMAPHHGMPKGHLPVRSYLAVPVVSRHGSVIGGLFFGHPEAGVFTAHAEELISGIAAQASVAIDNATLYRAAQREIAERKRVAEELQEAREKLSHHAEDLEKQVALRTASLQEALAQLEEFSYSVSHDLRAPLRAIGGYNKVVRDDFRGILPPEAIGYLDRIERSAQRMECLINDVLTMSRVARAEVNLRPVTLQSFIKDIIEHYSNMQLPAADVSIDTPHSVLADDVALGQALTNLLSNSVKFVRPGGKPKVSVRSERNDGRVKIWVEDEGIGIPAHHREKLFGMFQRLPGTSKFEGTGIGLAIVRKAVERMGGKVGMEPNEPHGSRFWIELKGVE
jgi:signal transduction histidine kinase